AAQASGDGRFLGRRVSQVDRRIHSSQRPAGHKRGLMNSSALATVRSDVHGVLLQRLRIALLRNTVRAAVGGSTLRVGLIVFGSLLLWGGIVAARAEPFHFLMRQRIPLTGGIVGTVLDLLFVALTVLFLFSSGIILYSSLFSNAEASFLLSTPARAY